MSIASVHNVKYVFNTFFPLCSIYNVKYVFNAFFPLYSIYNVKYVFNAFFPLYLIYNVKYVLDEKTICFSREKCFECLKRYTFLDFDGKTRVKWKLPLRSRAVKYAFNAFSRYSQFITWNMYSMHFSRYIQFITWNMHSIHFSRYIRFITWNMYWMKKPFVFPEKNVSNT